MKTITAASFKNRIFDIVEKEVDALSRRRDEERDETSLKPSDLSLLKYAHALASEIEEQEAVPSDDKEIKHEKSKEKAKHPDPKASFVDFRPSPVDSKPSPLANLLPSASLSAPAPLLPQVMDAVPPDVVRKVDDALRKQGIDPNLDDDRPPNPGKAAPMAFALRRR